MSNRIAISIEIKLKLWSVLKFRAYLIMSHNVLIFIKQQKKAA